MLQEQWRVQGIRALDSRVGSHTFFSAGEERWMLRGILGGLLRANQVVKAKGACASKKNIAADRNNMKSKGKKTPGKVQSEVVTNLKKQEGKRSLLDIASRVYKTWENGNYSRSRASTSKSGCKQYSKTP